MNWNWNEQSEKFNSQFLRMKSGSKGRLTQSPENFIGIESQKDQIIKGKIIKNLDLWKNIGPNFRKINFNPGWAKEEKKCKTNQDCQDSNQFCFVVKKGKGLCATKTCTKKSDCKVHSHCMLSGIYSPLRCFVGRSFRGKGDRKGQCIYDTEHVIMC